MRRLLIVTLVLAACGPRKDPAAPEPSPPVGTTTTETKVVEEGGKKKTITITKTTVPAPAPPARPADPWPSDPLVKHNVDRINEYRKKHGVAPLLYDAKISAFALEGSKQLAADHKPHAHFNAKIKSALGDPEAMKGKSGFGSRAAENQGDWDGIPELAAGKENGKQQIDVTMKLMYDEGPGGGHHDNMLNPKLLRVGVGLHYVGPKLYLTNDFSD
ncbi:MAG: CAP domain-containing protein [Sandaracinaceae bacterium]|nr:CAP domain-containing protein [Sandaracinaceae bacterium]